MGSRARLVPRSRGPRVVLLRLQGIKQQRPCRTSWVTPLLEVFSLLPAEIVSSIGYLICSRSPVVSAIGALERFVVSWVSAALA